MLSKKKGKEGLPLKDLKSDNKWLAYYKEKFGSASTRSFCDSRFQRSPELQERVVGYSSSNERKACKRSNSIVLPVAFKRIPSYDEQRKSPVRVLGGGNHDRKRSVSSKNLNVAARRRSSHVDDFFRSPSLYSSGETDPLQSIQPAPSRPSGSSTGSCSAARDLRRRLESTSYQAERSRGSDREDDKFSLSRRKSATVGPQLSCSDNVSTYSKPSQRFAEKSHKALVPNQVRQPNFGGLGTSKAGTAGPPFSQDSSSASSHESGYVGESSQGQRRIVAGESSSDSSCSSSGSFSPISLNSRLTEMKLRSDPAKRPLADEKLPASIDGKSNHLTSFSRAFPMDSVPGMQRDSPNRSRTGRDIAGLVGLVNEGNTCYLNSCLQCLAHCLPLASAVQGSVESLMQRRGSGMRAGTLERDWSTLAELLAFSFRQVVRDLWQRPAFMATSARMFLQCVQAWAPQFAGHSQHDAQVWLLSKLIPLNSPLDCRSITVNMTQEVLRAILDGLHEALNRVTTAPPYRDLYLEPKPEEELAELTWRYHKLCQDSIIQDIFCGQLQSTIECCTCHRTSHCFDPFHDLSLPLPKSERDFGMRDQLMIGNLRAKVTLHDCLSAFVAPEQLEGSNKYYCPSCKRFYKSDRFSYQKDDTPVYYPLKGLDFTDFLSARARRGDRQGVVYDLYGVCCHMGSLGCGHYTAQCKNWENDLWYCFNDSSVSPLQDAVVLNSSAYILFYQQRP